MDTTQTGPNTPLLPEESPAPDDLIEHTEQADTADLATPTVPAEQEQAAPGSAFWRLLDKIRNAVDPPEDPRRRKLLKAGFWITTLTAAGFSLEDLVDHKDYDPSRGDIAAVEDLIAQEQARQMVPNHPDVDFNQLARELNLTLGNREHMDAANAMIDRLLDSRSGENAPTFEECLELAQTCLRQYNIQIDLGTSAHVYIPPGRPLTAEERDSHDTKYTLLSLATNILSNPKELMQLTGLHNIYLVHLENQSGYANPDALGIDMLLYSSGSYFIDPQKSWLQGWGGSTAHEVYHLYDGKTNGILGMHTDHNFEACNPEDARRYPLSSDYLSDEQYQAELERASGQEYDTLADAQQAQARLDAMASRVVVASEYGRTMAREDKSEIGKRFLDSAEGWGSVLDPRKTALRAKTLFLLGRLYRQNPNLVKFLIPYNSVVPRGREIATRDGHIFTLR